MAGVNWMSILWIDGIRGAGEREIWGKGDLGRKGDGEKGGFGDRIHPTFEWRCKDADLSRLPGYRSSGSTG